MSAHSQKITFGEMRASGVRNVLIYCSDYRCRHCVTVEACADRWPDDLRLSDIEAQVRLHQVRSARRRHSAGLDHGADPT